MCLAVPLELMEKSGDMGIVEMGGVRRKVNISFVENAKPGDYLIIHAGFAITILDRKEAEETLKILNECIALGEKE